MYWALAVILLAFAGFTVLVLAGRRPTGVSDPRFDVDQLKGFVYVGAGAPGRLPGGRRGGAVRGGPPVLVPRKGNLLTLGPRPGTHLAAFSSVALRLGSPPSSALRCTHLDDANRQGTSLPGH